MKGTPQFVSGCTMTEGYSNTGLWVGLENLRGKWEEGSGRGGKIQPSNDRYGGGGVGGRQVCGFWETAPEEKMLGSNFGDTRKGKNYRQLEVQRKRSLRDYISSLISVSRPWETHVHDKKEKPVYTNP